MSLLTAGTSNGNPDFILMSIGPKADYYYYHYDYDYDDYDDDYDDDVNNNNNDTW